MQINSECCHCMNASARTDEPGSSALCPHCQKPLQGNVNVLVAEARREPTGLRFDLESMLALSAFALIIVVAVLFYTRFHA